MVKIYPLSSPPDILKCQRAKVAETCYKKLVSCQLENLATIAYTHYEHEMTPTSSTVCFNERVSITINEYHFFPCPAKKYS